MDNVRIALLNTYDKVCAFLDNDAPESMHYYQDELHQYLKGSAATYSFKTSAEHKDAAYLTEGNKLAFRYKNCDFYLNIMTVTRGEYEVEVEAYSLNFELLNEQKESYKAANAMTFAQYLNIFDYEKVVTLGINEVSDKSVKHEWSQTETMLARIFSLADAFEAEVEFVPRLNPDYSLNRIVMNVYKKHSDTVQGVGTNRTDVILRYGVNVSGITKTSDITELYTAIRPIGKNGLTVSGLNKTEYDADGKVEYICPSGKRNIYAVQARDRFPSNLMAGENERYIAEIWEYDTDNVNTLYTQALTELKKNCIPQVSYEAEGYFDTGIGDTVTIVDEEYNPELYLQARVTEQSRSFTEPDRNKTTFSNYKELRSEIDPALLKKMNELFEENKVYVCSITTDNGIVFKNNEGSTTLTAYVLDGGKDITNSLNIRWLKNGQEISSGKSMIVMAADVSGKEVYRYEVTDAGGGLRGSYEVTITNINDGEKGDRGEKGDKGEQGLQGDQGIQGPSGNPGKSSYFHIKYSPVDNPSASQMTETPDKYIGTYVDFMETDSNNPKDYKWQRLEGAQGPAGARGIPGENGEDGNTSFLHIKYSNDGGKSFTDNGGETPGSWLGIYVDFYQPDSDKPGDYKWKKIEGEIGNKGDTGEPGKGIKERNAYYLVSSKDSGITTASAGWQKTIPTITETNRYLWIYEEYIYTDETKDNTTPRITGVYGEKGDRGDKGDKGEQGEDAAVVSPTEPSDRTKLWCDTSIEPPLIKHYNNESGAWEIVNDQSNAIETIYQSVYADIDKKKDEILSEVGEITYLKGDIDSKIGEVSTSFEQTKNAFAFDFKELTKNLNELSSGTDSKFNEIKKYIRFIEGAIVIGMEGNPLTLRMINDRISFLENGNEVAYISNRRMYITDAEILSSLILGNFAYTPRTNGNLSFGKVR